MARGEGCGVLQVQSSMHQLKKIPCESFFFKSHLICKQQEMALPPAGTAARLGRVNCRHIYLIGCIITINSVIDGQKPNISSYNSLQKHFRDQRGMI